MKIQDQTYLDDKMTLIFLTMGNGFSHPNLFKKILQQNPNTQDLKLPNGPCSLSKYV